jgi:hypothetical protein
VYLTSSLATRMAGRCIFLAAKTVLDIRLYVDIARPRTTGFRSAYNMIHERCGRSASEPIWTRTGENMYTSAEHLALLTQRAQPMQPR